MASSAGAWVVRSQANEGRFAVDMAFLWADVF